MEHRTREQELRILEAFDLNNNYGGKHFPKLTGNKLKHRISINTEYID
ncbi:MAG: hypothetical protein O7C75_02550 [Verrucomicrobia bacterium]|nr:hypothetical protein [Verrucomicrobiota bacterium]